MAVAAVAKEGIEKELTCPLCLDIFREPKKLPCDHIYCKEPCLKGLLLRSLNGAITCPECRTVVQVPQNDLNNLPTAFRVNRLKKVFEAMQQKEETDSQVVKQSEQATCTTHKSQPLAIYCETCEEVLCRDCLLKSDTHKDHHHGFIEEVAEKQREAVMKHVETARNLEINLSSAIEQISQERLKVETQTKSNLDQLDASCEAIVSAIIREKEQLRSSINKKAQQNTDVLKRQEENLTTCLRELSNITERAKTSIQNESDQEICRNKRMHTVELKQTCTKVKGLPLQPADRVDYGLHFTSSDEMVACYKQGIYQCSLIYPQKEKGLLQRAGSLEMGKKCTFILQVKDYTGKQNLQPGDIQVKLLRIRNNKTIHGLVTSLTIGRYSIKFTPQSRGRHLLSVKVDNSDISGSPFSVFVQKPPKQLRQAEPTHTITELHHPAGLTWFNDMLYVTNNFQVSVLNENLKVIETYQLVGANEIAIDTETRDWFVTDAENHQLHKLNECGICIKSVGSQGSGPDQFNFPNSLGISKGGELFVCDTRNHRIKVYNKELELQRIIGRQETEWDNFRSPDNLAFDETGNLFVTDQYNHHVQVLSPNGKTIQTIGRLGCRPGELDNPIGIAISGQYMYIVEYGNKRISVFTTQGEFVTTFGTGFLRKPECIAIDRDGYVYISDNNEKVFLF